MKKHMIPGIFLPAAAILLFLMSGFTIQKPAMNNPSNPGDNIVIPDDVNAIIENKCFGCHNVDSKSDKAKKKLLFDELTGLSKAKIVAKLDDIHDVVDEGKMPPEKFLERYPDKTLTEDEAAKLKEWAQSTSDELMK